MELSRRSAVGLVMMNALAAATVRGQNPQPSTPSGPPSMPKSIQNSPAIPDFGQQDEMSGTPMGERMRISAEKAHNDDRRKRMLADADKLLSLSTELKADIEKSTKDELSMEVIRKAAELEKLAHDVQQRMKS